LPVDLGLAQTGVGCRFFDEDRNLIGSFKWLEHDRTLSEACAAAATISTHLFLPTGNCFE
jgi:hypothetical protein